MSNNLKLLIVDDAAFIRDLVKKAIKMHLNAIEVFEAPDGKKAQAMIKTHRFDVILCDWEMPEMSGLELLTWLREQPKYEKLPFMMVTSRGDKSHVVAAVEAGVSDYIGKPFNNDQLIQKLTKLIYRAYKIKPPELQGRRSGSDHADGSVQALTAAFGGASVEKVSTPEPAAAPKAPATMAKAKGGKPLGIAQLRTGAGAVVNCAIKVVSLDEIVLAMKNSDSAQYPTVLDQSVVDFAQPDNSEDVARLNGFVYLIQAAEKKIDSGFVNVIIRWVDQDPEKQDWLNRFISAHQ